MTRALLTSALWSAFALVLACAFGTTLCSSMAAAQAGSESGDAQDADARARVAFDLGQEAYSNGQFEAALDQFRRAHELSPRPELLYNIATALDRLDRLADAVESFERYLAAVLDAGNRAYVQGRLAVIRRRLAETGQGASEGSAGDDAVDVASGGDETTESTESTTAGEGDDGSSVPIASIILFGMAGAAAIASVVTGILANTTYGDLEDWCPGGVCSEAERSDLDRLGTLTLTTDILWGTALASAVVGALLLLFGADDARGPSTVLSGGCTVDGCGVVLRNTF